MLKHRSAVAVPAAAPQSKTSGLGLPTKRTSVGKPPARYTIAKAVEDLETTKPAAPATAPHKEGAGAPQPPPPTPPKNKWPDKRPWAAVALDKVADTGDDILRHIKRQIVPLPTSSARDRLEQGGDGTLTLKTRKPVVLVLGAGWAAHSIIKVIDTDTYEVVVVSPRNHFIFTPMLPSTAVGTIEFRSLCEPIRTANPFVSYFEASCDQLDVQRKVALCTSTPAFEDGRRPRFEVPYDLAIVAVGELPATFGVPGVDKYCYFMKEIEDTLGLRKRISECFELASLPGTTEEECRQILSFVVVGGGPTGVEFAGTLNDFVSSDMKKKYSELMPYVRVTLLQSAQNILLQFKQTLAQRATQNLMKSGVDIRLGVRVVEVTQGQVVLGTGEKLDYGICVWSTGNTTRPLVKSIVDQIPEQKEYNQKGGAKLAVDPYMRVIGAEDVVALGDCSALVGNRLPATAQVAGQQGAYMAHVVNRGYRLGRGGVEEPPPVKRFKQQDLLAEINGAVGDYFQALGDAQWLTPPVREPKPEALPLEEDGELQYYPKPFEFLSLGLLAYVGTGKALTQFEAFDKDVLNLYGSFAFLLWRSVYITKQVSLRNRVLILFDWLKARLFGRDLSQF